VTSDRVGVLIVGGGPSGSMLGALLAQEGMNVRVVDKATFPRAKACGECVNPGAVRILERHGLLDSVLGCEPAWLHGWRMSDHAGALAVGRFPRNQHGLGVSRERLDASLLLEAARRGVDVRERSKVVGLSRHPGGGFLVTIRRSDGCVTTTHTRLLVGADGIRSTVSRRLQLLARRPRLRKLSLTCRIVGRGPDRRFGSLHFAGDVTIGLAPVRVEEPLWNGTVVFARATHGLDTRDPMGLFQAFFRLAPFDWAEPPSVEGGPWASGPFDWPTRSTVADDVLLVGDAAGYFDPLTGQGIHWSLRSAELAAHHLIHARRSGAFARADLVPYHRALRREMRVDRWLQRSIELVVTHSVVRRAAIRVLGRVPAMANRLVAATGNVVRSQPRRRAGSSRLIAAKQRL
jgi:flavin-dependent dehydrogenase